METPLVGERLSIVEIHALMLIIHAVIHADAATRLLAGLADQVDDASR